MDVDGATRPLSRRESLATHARGPVVVAAGAAVLGVFSYVYLTIAARRLDPASFGELSALWAAIFGFVAGLWYPFEQELTRLVASTSETVSVAAEDLRRVAGVQAVTLVVAEVVALAVMVATHGALFGGSVTIVVALLLSLLSLSAVGYQRGRLVGARRFGWAAVQQGTDGTVRAVGAIACAATGASVGAYALVLALAPLAGVIAALPGTPPSSSELAPTRSWTLVIQDLLALLAGSYGAIVLLNIGPLVVRVGAGAEQTGRFMAVFIVARLPLFFASPVVAGLLPSFVDAYAADSGRSFTRFVRNVTGVVAAVVVPGCLLLGLLGPWLARVFFGSAYTAELSVSVLLATSSALFVLGLLMQGALVASDRQRAVAWSWLAAAIAFAATLTLPLELTVRVSLGYVLSGVVVVIVMGIRLSRVQRPLDAA